MERQRPEWACTSKRDLRFGIWRWPDAISGRLVGWPQLAVGTGQSAVGSQLALGPRAPDADGESRTRGAARAVASCAPLGPPKRPANSRTVGRSFARLVSNKWRSQIAARRSRELALRAAQSSRTIAIKPSAAFCFAWFLAAPCVPMGLVRVSRSARSLACVCVCVLLKHTHCCQ